MTGYPSCKINESRRTLTDTNFKGISWKDLQETAVKEAERCLGAFFCDACDLCLLLCPDLCITRDSAGVIQIDLDYCKGCGVCAAICPKSAIEMVQEKGD